VNQIRKSRFTAVMPTENVPTGIHEAAVRKLGNYKTLKQTYNFGSEESSHNS
jgi:hypothetical protein